MNDALKKVADEIIALAEAEDEAEEEFWSEMEEAASALVEAKDGRKEPIE